MQRIIDFHAHIGDIFHQNKNITFKKPAEFCDYPDPFKVLEENGYNAPLTGVGEKEQNEVIDAGQFRTWKYGTLCEVSKSLDENHIDYIVMLPAMPNVSFEEVLAASKFDGRIIPFTSADMELSIPSMIDKLREDIRMGAKGLKLHPILQNEPLDSPRTAAAVELFGELDLPVLTHSGVTTFYKKGDPNLAKINGEYGNVMNTVKLLKKYPHYKIVVGHGGGTCGGELEILAENTKELDNFFIDSSFRSAQSIKKAVSFFGEDRVLFGTDYPFTKHVFSINEVKKAFADNPKALDKVLFANAAGLLGLL